MSENTVKIHVFMFKKNVMCKSLLTSSILDPPVWSGTDVHELILIGEAVDKLLIYKTEMCADVFCSCPPQ